MGKGGEEVTASVSALIEEASVFAALPPDAREQLVSGATLQRLAEGEWLFRTGDPADSLYLVDTGSLEVIGEADDEEQLLWTCSRGVVVGELAALAQTSRSAGVRARRDATVVRVDATALTDLVRDHPGFAQALVRGLATQLQASAPRRAASGGPPRVIAVVSASAAITADAVAAALGKQLERHGSVAEVGPRSVDAGALDIAHQVAQLVSRAERACDRVLLRPDSAPAGTAQLSEWTRACIREADRVVLVLGADAAPPPQEFRHEAIELLLVGPAPSAGALRGLLDELKPRNHWFARDPADGDGFGALARSLAWRSVALVLSGGGARGFAHIGVMEELQRAEVIIDRYAGTSMGAYVGALAALGHEPHEIRERLYEDFVKHNPLGDATLPIVALSRGKRGRTMVERAFGEMDIEQLRHPFFCVTVDIKSGQEIVHDRGWLAGAVGGSMAIPGYVPPVPFGEYRLVDGGMVNNFPVDHMLERADGPIIGCDVFAGFEASARDAAGPWIPWAPAGLIDLVGRLPNFGLSLATRGARRLLTTWTEPVPTLPEVLSRVVTLPGRLSSEANGSLADVLVQPDVSDIGVFAFERLDEVIERGRLAARAALAADGLPAGLSG